MLPSLRMEACFQVGNLDFTQTEKVHEHIPQDATMNPLTYTGGYLWSKERGYNASMFGRAHGNDTQRVQCIPCLMCLTKTCFESQVTLAECPTQEYGS